MLPNFWFERAIAEMGKSMGVTATGLLLLRIVDPEQETEAASAFGYKQLLHEPFMGGGLWTSTAVLLIAQQGGWLVFGISAGAIAVWAVVWRVFLKKRMPTRTEQE
jgi:ESS family glutamate:Na+ symporter